MIGVRSLVLVLGVCFRIATIALAVSAKRGDRSVYLSGVVTLLAGSD